MQPSPGDTVLGGVLVELEDASGNVLATTTTAADGSYDFSGLSDGTYQVLAIDQDTSDPQGTGSTLVSSLTVTSNQVLTVNIGVVLSN